MTSASTPGSGECIFCAAAAAAPGEAPLVIARGRHTFVILNLFPYNNGHLMVVPNRHIASLAAATPEELGSSQLTATRRSPLARRISLTGSTSASISAAAGAGIVDHSHVHLVPRWIGDTNFMSAVAETRVLPETLDQTVARLRPIFERLLAAKT